MHSLGVDLVASDLLSRTSFTAGPIQPQVLLSDQIQFTFCTVMVAMNINVSQSSSRQHIVRALVRQMSCSGSYRLLGLGHEQRFSLSDSVRGIVPKGQVWPRFEALSPLM